MKDIWPKLYWFITVNKKELKKIVVFIGLKWPEMAMMESSCPTGCKQYRFKETNPDPCEISTTVVFMIYSLQVIHLANNLAMNPF